MDDLAIEFEGPEGDALRFEWEAARLASLEPDPVAEPVWRLGGELDWDRIERVRVLSARLADGRLLAIVALRPAGLDGHGDEVVAGALGEPGGFEQLHEVLFSTEYDPDGRPRRVGLELYGEEGALPNRLAAEVSAIADGPAGGVERLSAALALRGEGGAGTLDLLRLP